MWPGILNGAGRVLLLPLNVTDSHFIKQWIHQVPREGCWAVPVRRGTGSVDLLLRPMVATEGSRERGWVSEEWLRICGYGAYMGRETRFGLVELVS